MTRIKCTHCHRTLRREPVQVDGRSYGPTCARNLFGRSTRSDFIGQPGRVGSNRVSQPRRVVRDGMTLELFA